MTHCENLLPCIYAFVWIGLIWIIIIPFEIYATINLYRHRHHAAIIKRYPAIVVAAAIFSMIHQLICETFYYLESGINLDILHTNSALYIARILFSPLLLIMIVIVVFRVYLMHFDINYAVSQSTHDWQSLLSDTVNNHDFYTRYHTTFGNWKYVSKYFIMYLIIVSVIDVIIKICQHLKLLAIPPDLLQLIYVFWSFIMVLFAAYLFMKTPQFEDVYFVKKELKYLLYVWGSCLSLYIAMIILSSDTMFGRLANEIQTSSMTIANFGGIVISEYIVLSKIKRADETAFNFGTRARTQSIRRVSIKKRPSATSHVLFNVLIASPVGIDFFVKHLRSEFAIENLLCFIELIQWIYLSTNKDFSNFNIKPLDKIEFELNSAIPLSSANNQHDNNEWDWKQSILLIHRKYIHSSAEYQVNLPYDVQNSFNNLINLLQIKQQIINKTYVFKHGPKLSSSSRRNRKDKEDKKTSSLLEMNMLRITEQESAVNHSKLYSNRKDMIITPLSSINNSNPTPVPNVATFTDNLQIGSCPDHQLVLTAKVSPTNSFSKSKIVQKKFNTETKSNPLLKSSNKYSEYSNHSINDNNKSSSQRKHSNNESNKASVRISINSNNSNDSNNDSNKCKTASIRRVNISNNSNKTSSVRNNSNNSNKSNKSSKASSTSDVVEENKEHLTVSDALLRNDSMKNQKGFVFVDDEYDDKECKDQEISCSANILNEIFEEEMCKDSVIGDDEGNKDVIIPCIKPCDTKIENSVVYSVKQSLRKLGTFIGGTNDDKCQDGKNSNNIKLNELHIKELEQYEKAKKLNLNEFVSIVCQSLHVILQLNYRSISRFKRSERYVKFLQTVNLDNLIKTHGNKGC